MGVSNCGQIIKVADIVLPCQTSIGLFCKLLNIPEIFFNLLPQKYSAIPIALEPREDVTITVKLQSSSVTLPYV
jgi:hypothetical protein